MKNLFLLSIFIFSVTAIKAQVADTIPQDAFAFPLGNKVTIKLVPKDSVNFQYYVTDFSQFTEIIDRDEDKNLLSETPAPNTIEFIFCISTRGKTQEEKEKNYKTLLILRNNLPFPLKYNADMRVYQREDFEPTSVVTLYPKVLTREMWPYTIEEIALYNFRRMQKLPHIPAID